MYTIEVYKLDRRTRAGERLIEKRDVDSIDAAIAYPEKKGHRVEIRKTWVTRTNLVTGLEYQERYDTPLACSPASDTYWSI